MNVKLILVISFVVTMLSCSKDDAGDMFTMSEALNSKFIYKIIKADDGYWLITRSAQSPECPNCASFSLVEGLAFFSDNVFNGKDNLGMIRDAEVNNNNELIAITPTEIVTYDKAIQKSTLKTAGSSEIFKLLDKDDMGRIWVLSSRSIFNLEGEKIPFPYDYQFLDFEVNKDSTFWLASNDTIFHVGKSNIKRYCIKQIADTQSVSLYNLNIDRNMDVWINTSDMAFKFYENKWKDAKPATYIDRDFKTIPYMDVDDSGNLWLAERNYQSFTDLHCFDGSQWKSYKLTTPIDSWINDIEEAEPGYIWIGTDTGLIRYSLN